MKDNTSNSVMFYKELLNEKDKQIENLKCELEKIKTTLNENYSSNPSKQSQTIPAFSSMDKHNINNDHSSLHSTMPAKQISQPPNFKLDLKCKIEKISTPDIYSERANSNNNILNKAYNNNLFNSAKENIKIFENIKGTKLNSTYNNYFRKSQNNTNKTSFIVEKELKNSKRELGESVNNSLCKIILLI